MDPKSNTKNTSNHSPPKIAPPPRKYGLNDQGLLTINWFPSIRPYIKPLFLRGNSFAVGWVGWLAINTASICQFYLCCLLWHRIWQFVPSFLSKKSPTRPTFHGPLALSIQWLDRNLLQGSAGKVLFIFWWILCKTSVSSAKPLLQPPPAVTASFAASTTKSWQRWKFNSWKKVCEFQRHMPPQVSENQL